LVAVENLRFIARVNSPQRCSRLADDDPLRAVIIRRISKKKTSGNTARGLSLFPVVRSVQTRADDQPLLLTQIA
jgi:hypothetical protein